MQRKSESIDYVSNGETKKESGTQAKLGKTVTSSMPDCTVAAQFAPTTI